MSTTDSERKLELDEIDAEEKLEKLKSLSNFSFYFGLISLLLFSWFFQLIVWGVLDVSKIALIVYLIISVVIPLGGLICGIMSRTMKKGLVGLILNTIILFSYLCGTITFLMINSIG